MDAGEGFLPCCVDDHLFAIFWSGREQGEGDRERDVEVGLGGKR